MNYYDEQELKLEERLKKMYALNTICISTKSILLDLNNNLK